MPSPARIRAVEVLHSLEQDRGTLGDHLAAADLELADPRERGFLHELVLGSLRARGRLDYVLTALIDRPLERVDPAALTVLRLGAYQMLDLRVPDRAAVSEAVDLVRAHAPAAGGFVNAILRRLGREGPRALPDPERQPLAWLTSGGSLPTWLAERWLARLGPQAAVARATALLEKPPTTVRLNPRLPEASERVVQAGITLRPLTLAGAFDASGPSAVPLAEEGVLYLQDEGSQVVGHLASTPGRILDACAAPGGKAMLMADLGADRVVYAGEPGARRRDSMARLVARWRSKTLRIVGADARRPPFPDACFDSVLLDAPCSGLGTLGRHPDIRWRTKATDPARHARLQESLLASLAPVVRPGGLLVYATCSSEPEENEAVVERFLANSPAYRLEAPPAWARPFTVGPHVRTDREGAGDAFFAALLRRS